jgi:hypothetical protein
MLIHRESSASTRNKYRRKDIVMSDENRRESVRPTERAKYWYQAAQGVIAQISATVYKQNMDLPEMIRAHSWAMRNQLFGDQEIATGLRATYILLQQIDKRLERLEQAQRR